MAQRAANTDFVTVSIDRPQRLGILAARLSRTLGLARALAQNGRVIDLSGIEDGVGMLCAQTLDLSFAEGRQMLPVLQDVVAQLDALRQVLHGGGIPPIRSAPHHPPSASP